MFYVHYVLTVTTDHSKWKESVKDSTDVEIADNCMEEKKWRLLSIPRKVREPYMQWRGCERAQEKEK